MLKQGGKAGIAIGAQNVPANSKHDAYAVWLYNSPTDSHILGFVNPAVGSNGELQAGRAATNAAHYKQLLVTLETQQSPKAPGQIVLQGQLKRLSGLYRLASGPAPQARSSPSSASSSRRLVARRSSRPPVRE